MQTNNASSAPTEPPPPALPPVKKAGGFSRLRAAEYVRMSTEHQKYSTENQRDNIREYAELNDIDIVRTYADEGKSGLRLDGREALQQLIQDVESGQTDFTLILVYDISRWGRFQNADESAYYEHLCERKGIHVEYCAEMFKNDGSTFSTIVKNVKRTMAGEYSRELSTKVFNGQCRLIALGYRQGGPAGYGLRRVLIDQTGAIKGELARGEHKSLQTDRVILKPGPVQETTVVSDIYDWFLDEGLSETEIANRLNERGIQTDWQRAWTRATVQEVLTNEKYIGNNVYNRISFKLKKRRVVNQPSTWIRKEGAFEALVNPEKFYMVQGMLRARTHRYSKDELLDKLRQLLAQKGYLSGLVINETEGMPSSCAYVHHFGSLIRAYQAVGFTPDRDYRYLEINQLIRRLHPEVVQQTIARITEMGGVVALDPFTDLLWFGEETRISIALSRCHLLPSGARRWKVRFDTSLQPDITVVVRLDEGNAQARDYYLLPRLDFGHAGLSLAEQNAIEYESYRFDTLDFLYEMALRTRLGRVA